MTYFYTSLPCVYTWHSLKKTAFWLIVCIWLKNTLYRSWWKTFQMSVSDINHQCQSRPRPETTSGAEGRHIVPHPSDLLTFWPWKWCPSHVSVPILVFLGLSVLDIGPTYATDVVKTDVRQHHCLVPPPKGLGNNMNIYIHRAHEHQVSKERWDWLSLYKRFKRYKWLTLSNLLVSLRVITKSPRQKPQD